MVELQFSVRAIKIDVLDSPHFEVYIQMWKHVMSDIIFNLLYILKVPQIDIGQISQGYGKKCQFVIRQFVQMVNVPLQKLY